MKKKILIVEDEESIIELISTVFSFSNSYQILCSRDGEEALKIAKEDSPDIVLLDMHIPKIDGIEVCRLLKSSPLTSDIKILLLTGISQRHELDKAKKAGVDAYIIKPFNIDTLIKTVEKFLNSNSEN